MKVYLDQDGVLADFDRGLLEGHGIKNCKKNYATPWEHKSSEQRKIAHDVIKAMEVEGFFQNLPVMKDAHKLWMIAGPSSCIVLTAVPNLSCDARIAREKRIWIEDNFGHVPDNRFIACLKSEKALYATSDYCVDRSDRTRYPIIKNNRVFWREANILVDDDEGNCSRWREAGGIAILFENMDDTIKILNDTINKMAA